MTQATPANLETARDAIARHAWAEARDLLLEAEAAAPLSADDLQRLSDAQFWTGHPAESLDALERAYAAYVDAGERTWAAGVALRLFFAATQRVATRAAAGWLARAQRLLEDEPKSSVHAVLTMFEGWQKLGVGDFGAAFELGSRAVSQAREFGDRDTQAMATNLMGQALIHQGRVEEGFALIDESASAAAGGELDAFTTAGVYCATMGACRDVSDWQRASEWTDESDREMQRQRISGYPGVCRVHRAEAKRLRGDWSAAEQEVREALSGNLCRCTGYQGIVNAVLQAARAARAES